MTTGSGALYGSPTAALTPAHPQALSTVGGQPHENTTPSLTLSFCIAIEGIFPQRR